MASVIRGSDNFDTTVAIPGNGIATAWVNFNGTGTVAIRDQYNVASITDNSSGNYNINFSTLMDNADYAMSSIQGASTTTGYIRIQDSTTPTTSTVRITALNATGTSVQDPTYVQAIFLGGKN